MNVYKDLNLENQIDLKEKYPIYEIVNVENNVCKLKRFVDCGDYNNPELSVEYIYIPSEELLKKPKSLKTTC